MIIGSVVISYILKSLCVIIHDYIFTQISYSFSWRVIILSLTSLILSVLCVIMSESKLFNKVALTINHKSLHNDIWQDIIDYKNGTSLRVIYDDATYIGVLAGHEEKGMDSWFVLENYIVEENGKLYETENIGIKTRVVLNLKNAKRIELYYGNPLMTHTEKLILRLQNIFKG